MKDNKAFIDSTLAKWILAIIALLGFGWGFFQTFHIKNPKLGYEIVSEAKMFNKQERLSTVRLLVDTVDVLNGGQNISFYALKIQNIGNQHLKWSDYDEGKFGLIVQNGLIFQDVRFGEASTSHIENRYKEQKLSFSEHFIEIPKISLDRKEWYIISFSVIHEDDANPSFMPYGKIIGQKQISVLEPTAEEEQLSFSEKLFFGGFWTNLARALVFPCIWIVILLIIGFSASAISEESDKRKKERVKNLIIRNSEIPSFIRDEYLEIEDTNIKIANHYLCLGNNQLNRAYKKALEYISSPENVNTDEYDRYKTLFRDVNILLKKGYLIKDIDGNITIPREVKEAVEKIEVILKKNKMDSSLIGVTRSIYSSEEMGIMLKKDMGIVE